MIIVIIGRWFSTSHWQGTHTKCRCLLEKGENEPLEKPKRRSPDLDEGLQTSSFVAFCGGNCGNLAIASELKR